MPTFEQLAQFALANDPFISQGGVTANLQSFENAASLLPRNHPIISYNETLFNNGVVIQTRKDVLNRCKEGSEMALLATLYWGFNRNQHGLGTHLYASWDNAIAVAKYLVNNPHLTRLQYLDDLVPLIQECTGLGLSFFSKLLYFMKISIDGHLCVIHDSRVQKTLRGMDDARIANLKAMAKYSYSRYPDYIREVNHLANEIQCRPDQIEYALFYL